MANVSTWVHNPHTSNLASYWIQSLDSSAIVYEAVKLPEQFTNSSERIEACCPNENMQQSFKSKSSRLTPEFDRLRTMQSQSFFQRVLNIFSRKGI